MSHLHVPKNTQMKVNQSGSEQWEGGTENLDEIFLIPTMQQQMPKCTKVTLVLTEGACLSLEQNPMPSVTVAPTT